MAEPPLGNNSTRRFPLKATFSTYPNVNFCLFVFFALHLLFIVTEKPSEIPLIEL